MIYIDEVDFKIRFLLERFLTGKRELTKMEMAYLNKFVGDNLDLRLNEARVLSDGKYLMVKRYKVELILVKDGKSKTIKVMPLGAVPLRYQTTFYMQLSSSGKRDFNENKSEGVVNRFKALRAMLAPKSFLEQVLNMGKGLG